MIIINLKGAHHFNLRLDPSIILILILILIIILIIIIIVINYL